MRFFQREPWWPRSGRCRAALDDHRSERPVNVPASQLTRVFNAGFGVSPMRVLTRLRAETRGTTSHDGRECPAVFGGRGVAGRESRHQNPETHLRHCTDPVPDSSTETVACRSLSDAGARRAALGVSIAICGALRLLLRYEGSRVVGIDRLERGR